jgi:hypothetical protein
VVLGPDRGWEWGGQGRRKLQANFTVSHPKRFFPLLAEAFLTLG